MEQVYYFLYPIKILVQQDLVKGPAILTTVSDKTSTMLNQEKCITVEL